MNILMSINGYKQIIGLIIFGVGSALSAVGAEDIGAPMVAFGGVLTGIGAGHQAVKKRKRGQGFQVD